MAEEMVFNARVNTGAAAKDLEPVEDQLKATSKAAKDLDKSMIDVNASFDEVYEGLKPLTTQIGELEDRMYQLRVENKQNTDEYKALEAQVVEYRKIIISTDKAVDQLAEQGRGLGAALQIGNTVVAGYSAVEGATALLGVENENLMQTMVKIQAAQAVLNSIEELKLALDKQSIFVLKAKQAWTFAVTTATTLYTAATTGATVATRIMSAAMLAIPILAILAAIVALISVIANFVTSEEKAEKQNEALTASFEKQEKAMTRLFEKRTAKLQDEIALMRARGATADEIHSAELRQLQEQEHQRLVSAKAQIDMITRRKQAYEQALREENNELAKSIKDEIQQHRDKYRDLTNDNQAYQRRIEILNAQFAADEAKRREQEEKDAAKEAEDAAKKRKEAREKREQLRIERQRLLADYYIATIEDEGVRSIVQLQENHKREREELIKKFGQDTELLKQLTTKQDAEIQDLNESIAKQQEEADKEADAKKKERQRTAINDAIKDRKAQVEGELIMMREDFEAQQALRAELAELELEQALAQENLTEGEKFKIQQEYAQKIQDLNDQTAQHEREVRQQTIDAMVSITNDGLTAIQGLSDAVFSFRMKRLKDGSAAEERAAKRQFEINKALQLASAVVSGYQAVQSALAQPVLIPAPFGTAIKVAMVAAAATSSAANIAKIAATTYQSASSGANNTNIQAPSVAGVNAGAYNPEQSTTTITNGLNGSGSGNALQNGPINVPAQKVYLTDSDIKGKLASQKKVEVIATVG